MDEILMQQEYEEASEYSRTPYVQDRPSINSKLHQYLSLLLRDRAGVKIYIVEQCIPELHQRNIIWIK